MTLPNQPQHISDEADIHLAILALNAGQIQTERYAAGTFKVSRATLHRRRAGTLARRDCQLEEEVIVKYILDLNLRGFVPTYAAVRDMANRLLAARGAD
jgi:hypothetical protein